MSDTGLNARGVISTICAGMPHDVPAMFARLDGIPPTVWVRSMLLLMKVINGARINYDLEELRREIAALLANEEAAL